MSEKFSKVQVTEFRAIHAYTYGWQLMKRTKKSGGGYSNWVSYCYQSELKKCAAELEQELIRECGAETMTELRRLSERIHEMMLETLDKGKLV